MVQNPFGILPTLAPFTFGTANCNDPMNATHIRVIHEAMEADVWFHSARMYGNSYETLRRAFDETPGEKPKMMIKVHGEDAQELRKWTEEALSVLGIDQIGLAQICGRPRLTEDLMPGCPLHEMMITLKKEGKVGGYILECFRPSSEDQVGIAERGLFDAFIFYYNIVDREVNNRLWDVLRAKNTNILALRTLGGGPDAMGYTGDRTDQFQQQMRDRIESIFAASGCADKLEFRLRFCVSHPQVKTAIGGTANPSHLAQLLKLNSGLPALNPETLASIDAIHREFFG